MHLHLPPYPAGRVFQSFMNGYVSRNNYERKYEMNRKHVKRLRKLVTVLRDADRIPFFRNLFTMSQWGWINSNGDGGEADCGTPACALGHYASRTDLQKSFALGNDGKVVPAGKISGLTINAAISRHFGVSYEENDELFGSSGCGDAGTPGEAADFVEQFAVDRELEYGLAK